LADVGSPYSTDQKTKKVVNAGEIYQRLEIVADAVINDTAQRDAIAIGGRLGPKSQEVIRAPTNTEMHALSSPNSGYLCVVASQIMLLQQAND
jgi:hypothetical protein